MLLALIICQLSVLVAANPFHKYPFVFLLDVGNEELEKTNTEQIRLSIPGGSVALRYPAIGDGDTIGHIRVSGIDFGTNLKANIVDGGPGYKYVVLVFMGNPGTPYDAVVTVQTVTDQTFDITNVGSVANSEGFAGQLEEDANNSAEDLSDDSSVNVPQSNNYIQSTNAELMQSSSNVYKYADSKVMDIDDYSDEQGSDVVNNDNDVSSEELDVDNQESDISVDENASGQKDIHKEYSDDIDQIDDPDVQVKGIDTVDEEDDNNDDEIGPKIDNYASNDYAENNEPVSVVDSGIYSQYDGLKPHLSGGEVYYRDDEQKINRPNYQQEPLDYEDPDEINAIFNDGEVHYDGYKYKDSNNNNYIDSDDSYAVAY